MQISAECMLLSFLAIFCSCDKWSENQNRRVLRCLERLIDDTDWVVSRFLVISDGVFELDNDFYRRYPNYGWKIHSGPNENLTGFYDVILSAKNFHSLNETLSTTSIQRIDSRAKIVIILMEDFSNIDEIHNASKDFPAIMWDLDKTRVTYLVTCKENVFAMTSFPFANNCRVGELEILDAWNGTSFEKGAELFPETMLDIRGCVQNYSMIFIEPMVLLVRKEYTKTGEMVLGGVGGKVISIVADKMNIKLHLSKESGEWYSPRDRFHLLMDQVIAGESLFTIIGGYPSVALDEVLHQDITYMELAYRLGYIPKAYEISWKNFVQPLSNELWMYVGYTAVLFCGSIYLINLCNRFGIVHEKFGIFDAYAIFLSNSRPLPVTCFGRYVMGMYVVYCLLINAAYNSYLISYLTTSNERRPINTHADLLASGVDFGGKWQNVYHDPSDSVLMEIYNNYKIWEFDEQKRHLVDRDGVVPFFTANDYIYDIYHIGNLRNQIRLLKQRDFSYQAYIPIRKGSPFVNGLRRYTAQVVQSGIPEYWLKNYTQDPSFARISDNTPVIITVQHITGILYLYAAGVFCCCLVFFAELIVHRFTSHSPVNSIAIFPLKNN